jgi:hypothetical protein
MNILNAMGFSVTELMFSMTILAIGLLSLAQMRVIALQSILSLRQFSTATDLALETIEGAKTKGIYLLLGGQAYIKDPDFLNDHNAANNTEAELAPAITKDTDIVADIEFDGIEVLQEDDAADSISTLCAKQSPDNCTATIINEDWDFVRIVNVKNIPPGSSDGSSIMKDINVIVLWEERGRTRSVNIRTVVARKDDDFF